ncbi:hypothetical protein TNCT_11041 [Trichonephila clavata]|uniref:Uncharacterized protein n=1 Tax=Trichonephila clavata TaxID=2740835 RepID=A0A8X6F365_TRICU|nr:hypothetical protein TNCT_11041 [Trichonephila clavata]
MFKNCRKEDLRIVALKLGETLSEKVTIVELTEIIKENRYFKEDVQFFRELIQYTIEDRKKAEESRLREKELELARLHRVNSDNERTNEDYNSLDALVKSVQILTVKVPNRSEEDVCWMKLQQHPTLQNNASHCRSNDRIGTSVKQAIKRNDEVGNPFAFSERVQQLLFTEFWG